MNVTLAKWTLYKECRAPSDHDTKKGRTKSTRDYETRETRKEPETNQEKNGQNKKKKINIMTFETAWQRNSSLWAGD